MRLKEHVQVEKEKFRLTPRAEFFLSRSRESSLRTFRKKSPAHRHRTDLGKPTLRAINSTADITSDWLAVGATNVVMSPSFIFLGTHTHTHTHSLTEHPEKRARVGKVSREGEKIPSELFSFSVAHCLPLTEREVKLVLCSLAIRTHKD